MTGPISELRNRPLFICGHPKSGTSLLRAIFDSHPQLVVYPEETVFFRRYLPKAQGLDLNSQLELADQLLLHIFRWTASNPVPDQDDFPGRDYSSIPFEEVRSQFRTFVGEQIDNLGEILSAAVMAFGKVSGQTGEDTRRWVEKSPYNEYYTQKIFSWWPSARCIHIVRDPRDNFASYRRKHPNWAPEFFAANWARSVNTGLDNQRLFAADRYLILRYEDLTRSPAEEIQKITEFLQIDWDSTLTAPTRAGEQWRGNSMFANLFEEISAAPIARWKDQLAPIETAVIELGTAPLFEKFGYKSETGEARGVSPRLMANTRLLTWPIRRRFRLTKHEANHKAGS